MTSTYLDIKLLQQLHSSIAESYSIDSTALTREEPGHLSPCSVIAGAAGTTLLKQTRKNFIIL